jgi:uncharacterized RDD family membrane protein YckC
VFLRFLALCGAAVVAAGVTFIAMFSAFSGSGRGAAYLAWAFVACGLIWVFYPIFAFATRERQEPAKR